MQTEKDNKTWCKRRHVHLRKLLYPLVWLYTHGKYPVKIEKIRRREQALILYNHQTALDQFFVGLAFPDPVYYVASEDLFSTGFLAKIMQYLVAPIPIKKQTTDIRAVKTCLRVAREGGSIAIAPEGNRTYSGRSCYINPAIASLAKKLGLPILLFRIEGGYGVHPRWSDKVRRGSMRAYVSQRIDPEELRQMSSEELYRRIREGLWVDEARVDGHYTGSHLAEYLERVFYVCPNCGLSSFESHRDVVRCLRCGCQVRYLPTRELEGVEKPFPYRFPADWYAAQEEFVRGLDPSAYTEKPLFRDTARLFRVIPYSRKETLRKQAEVALYGDRIVLDEGKENELSLPFSELSVVTVLGKNKLNLYHGETLYQLKGGRRFNALKYVQIYTHSKNISRGDTDAKFLGL